MFSRLTYTFAAFAFLGAALVACGGGGGSTGSALPSTSNAMASSTPTANAPTSPPVTTFALSANAAPQSIVSGPDGNLWFTEAHAIGRLTTSGQLTEFPDSGHGPVDITVGPDKNLWFTDGTQIGQITTAGVITHFGPYSVTSIRGITTGPDNELWVGFNVPFAIAKVSLGGSLLAQFSIPAGVGIAQITTGPDGNLWFTEEGANKVGRATTSGNITEFTVPTSNAGPLGITTWSDGNLWFTESSGHTSNQIGRITITGAITEFSVPGTTTLFGITSGSDGKLMDSGLFLSRQDVNRRAVSTVFYFTRKPDL